MRTGLMLLTALLPLSVFGGEESRAGEPVRKAELSLVSAIRSGNVERMNSTLSDAFQLSSGGRIYSKKEWIDSMKKSLELVAIPSLSIDVLSVKMSGGRAIAHTKTRLTGRVAGPGGVLQLLVEQSDDRELWIRSSGGWKLRSDWSLSERVTLNGTLLP